MAYITKIKLPDQTVIELHDETALHADDFSEIQQIEGKYTMAKIVEQHNALVRALKRLAAGGAAAFALVAGFCAQAEIAVETRRLDAVTNDERVVVGVVETHFPCWSETGAWGLGFTLSAQSSSQTVVAGWTNEFGQAFTQLRTTHVRNMEADLYGELHDEYTITSLKVGGWRCLTAGGSVTAGGHLTATASGVYRVCATNQFGSERVVEVPISDGAQDTEEEAVYVFDVAGFARKTVNDEALGWMNAAVNDGPGVVGTETTWYNWRYFAQPAWAATSAGNVGNLRPFALGTKFLVGATHYPDWCKWSGFQTVGSTTVKKGEWFRLDDWALSNGWSKTQVAAMNVDDVSIVPLDEGTIPLADLPWLVSEARLDADFGGNLKGVQGWAATQAHADPIQVVYCGGRIDGSSWSTVMGSTENRSDVKSKLLTMGVAYPVHSGDSGHPVYFRHDGKWILTSHFTYVGSGPSYVKALPVIRAYAASVGASLNVLE